MTEKLSNKCAGELRNDLLNKQAEPLPVRSESSGSVDDSASYRCACGCFLMIEGGWVGESHYDDFAKVYCSNPKCKLKKPNDLNQSERNNRGQ